MVVRTHSPNGFKSRSSSWLCRCSRAAAVRHSFAIPLFPTRSPALTCPTMNMLSSAAMLLPSAPIRAASDPSLRHSDHEEMNTLSRHSIGHAQAAPTPRRHLFGKSASVDVLCPENVAVRLIDSMAGIVNPTEQRRIARREQRRERLSSCSSSTSSDEQTSDTDR